MPLTGKFHSHLTVETDKGNDLARAVGGKLTTILLNRVDSGRQQVDPMITHHYVTGHKGLVDETDVLIQLKAHAHKIIELGGKVLRIKLEHEPLDILSDPNQVQESIETSIYTEVHIKTQMQKKDRDQMCALAAQHHWHPSTNPVNIEGDTVTQFLNRRYYGSVDLDEVMKNNQDIILLLDVRVLETKIETARYDTNDARDKWWMK
jgi:hypothetical protein